MKKLLGCLNVAFKLIFGLALCSVPLPALSEGFSEDLQKALDNSLVVKPERDLYSTIMNDGLVAVFRLNRDPKETDDDCKIDAMLIAKTAIVKMPTLQQVRTKFFLRTEDKISVTEINVSAKQVSDFGSKKLDTKTLLDFIHVSKTSKLTTNDIKSRIRQYQNLGVDVSSYNKRVHELIDMKRNGAKDDEIEPLLQRMAMDLKLGICDQSQIGKATNGKDKPSTQAINQDGTAMLEKPPENKTEKSSHHNNDEASTSKVGKSAAQNKSDD